MLYGIYGPADAARQTTAPAAASRALSGSLHKPAWGCRDLAVGNAYACTLMPEHVSLRI